MTIEQMKARKAELGLTNEMISRAAGVPLGTVQKIFGGATKAPRRLTIQALEGLLKPGAEKNRGEITPGKTVENTGKKENAYPEVMRAKNCSVREAADGYSAAPREQLYTIGDYYALPDDQRMELIDGVFYDMGAPSKQHQSILGDLHILFRECRDKHKMPCSVLFAPLDVRLDRDDYTMVQPDLVVFCHDDDPDSIRYEGAPDLLVEILSPSTRMKDMILKLHKYQRAGVREYWIVDPEHRKVTVHFFEEDTYEPVVYGFKDTIPVRISGGECQIDFARVSI